MEYKNVIAIDAMGGDNAPAEIIKGAIEAINERADIKLRLFGDKDKIETELNKYTYNKERKLQQAPRREHSRYTHRADALSYEPPSPAAWKVR